MAMQLQSGFDGHRVAMNKSDLVQLQAILNPGAVLEKAHP
jgi:hypothetical protein